MQSLIQFKMTLQGLKPSIWRRAQVPGDMTLSQLHRVIQIAMGWEDYHLHEFTIEGKAYAEPDPENNESDRVVHDERKVRLRDIVSAPGIVFDYLYDYGDEWVLKMRAEGFLEVEEDDFYPAVISGKRHGPPEDAGGVWGYQEYLEALVDPDHERHEEMLNWRGPFDPEALSLDRINAELRKEFKPHAKRSREKKPTVH